MLTNRIRHPRQAPHPKDFIEIGGVKLRWEVSATAAEADFSLIDLSGERVACAALPRDAIRLAKMRLLPLAETLSQDDFDEIAIPIPLRVKRILGGGQCAQIDTSHFLSANCAKSLQEEALRVHSLPGINSRLDPNAYAVKFVASVFKAFDGESTVVNVLSGGGMRPIVLFNTDLTCDMTAKEISEQAFSQYIGLESPAHERDESSSHPLM